MAAMGEIQGYASTLPRAIAWHAISVIIDRMVVDTIDTDRPIAATLEEARSQVDAIATDGGGHRS